MLISVDQFWSKFRYWSWFWNQGAGRMVLETQGRKEHGLKKEGIREQGKRNLGAGSTKNWKREQGAAKNWEMEQGAREIIREQKEKLKRIREQREIKKEQWTLVKRSEHWKMEGSRENGMAILWNFGPPVKALLNNGFWGCGHLSIPWSTSFRLTCWEKNMVLNWNRPKGIIL